MLVSHKHKFVTIDVPKTGTTSINNALCSFMNTNDVTIGLSVDMGMRHSTYKECITKFPNCKNYFSFAFVRNPWERLLSFYCFKKQKKIKVKIDNNLSFKQYLKSSYFLSSFKDGACNQYLYLEGFNAFSFIGRFENIQNDFNIVCDKIGIPRQKLSHENKTKHKHYTEYYDDETKQIVAEKYARDIEYFGYKFGD